MSERNYYALLGVRRTADEAEIRSAYVRRLKNAHPDLQRSDPFPRAPVADLQRAYQVLRDADARSAHDAELQAAELARHARVQERKRRAVRKSLRQPVPAMRRPRPSAAKVVARWRVLLIVATVALLALEYAGRP